MDIKKKKRILPLLIIFAIVQVLVFANAGRADAAVPALSAKVYIRAYILSSKNNISVYTSSSLTTHGTASPKKAYNALVYPEDEIYIYKMDKESTYISYPTSSGRKYGYIKTSAVTSNNYSQKAKKSSAKITTYKRAGGEVYGSISKGDMVYATAQSGNYTQVVYPVDNVYKMGWITTKNYNQYINTASTSGIIQNGTYKLVSAIDNNYVWDIKSASLEDGANLQLYKDTGNMAQHFIFTYNNNGYYTITSARSNKVIDVSGAGTEDGTNIWQYTPNGSTAQQWKITDAGSGYCTLISRCNGKAADVTGGVAASGTNIQIYSLNGTASQKFKLVKVAAQQNNNQGMEARKRAVSYMESMASVAWTPSVSFKHWSYGKKNGNNHIWAKGTTYYGIPYSQTTRKTTLEKFQENMSGKTYKGPYGQSSYMGNDCSSAISFAYRQVNSKFPVTNTTGLYPAKGNTKRVGSYKDYGMVNSASICNKNGKTAIQNSYKQLQPGDLLLTSDHAHVMMVSEAGDGYVKVTHQTTYNSKLHSTWRVNEKWSYSSLYNAKFIPVTMQGW